MVDDRPAIIDVGEDDSSTSALGSGAQRELFGSNLLAFNDSTSARATSTALLDSAPVVELAQSAGTRPSFNPTTFSQTYTDMAIINAATGGGLGMPVYNPYQPGLGYGPYQQGFGPYQPGYNPAMPILPGMGRGNLLNQFNQGRYYQNPAGPYNGTSLTFPLQPTSITFQRDANGFLVDQTGHEIRPGDPQYPPIVNPNNSANWAKDPDSGYPIDPRTRQPISADDPRMDPDSDPNNPEYYLQIRGTRSVVNPNTGDVLTSSNSNNPLVPNQNNRPNQNNGENPNPNQNPNANNGRGNLGGGGGGMLGGGGLGGLLRIGMLIGVMSLLFRGGGGGMGMMMPLMAMGMMGGMGGMGGYGGNMMGMGLLPLMFMGLLGGGGSAISRPTVQKL